MKKVVKLFLFCFLVLSLTGCSEKLTVPDITGTDEDVAKNILSANGLIPNVNYEYSNDVAKGNVIRTVPEIGSSIEKNEKVVIYISNGPSFIKSTDSRITWWNISTNADSWEFYNPYIEDNILYIECYNVKFGQSLTWNDKYDYGNIIGIASVTDSFDKTIPVSGKYEKKSWKANESQKFTLEIPLKDLNISKPTDMYLKLFTTNNDVRVNFYMTW